jgi:cytochrome c5
MRHRARGHWSIAVRSTTAGAAVILLALEAMALPVRAIGADAAARPGDQTVARVCSNCHEEGLLGAPRIGDRAAWTARLSAAGSVEQLAQSAAHGKGNMPPRGGQSALTDDDLTAAIRYMLNRSGV